MPFSHCPHGHNFNSDRGYIRELFTRSCKRGQYGLSVWRWIIDVHKQPTRRRQFGLATNQDAKTLRPGHNSTTSGDVPIENVHSQTRL